MKEKRVNGGNTKRMFFEFFLCGIGSVLNVTGHPGAFKAWLSTPEIDHIAADFQRVGEDIQFALQREGPEIIAEAARKDEEQLKLALTGV